MGVVKEREVLGIELTSTLALGGFEKEKELHESERDHENTLKLEE